MWSDECSFRERHSPSPGSRTSGQTAQDLLIAGPSWHGSVPRNLTLVRSSTNTAFIIGRVYSDGTPPDLAQAHKLQAEFKLVPLSSFNKPFTPPAGQTGGPYAPKEIVRNVIAKMTASEYFNFMADAMKVSPPVSRRLTGCPLRTMTSYYACGCIGPRRLHPRYCRRRIHHGHLRQ